MVKKDWWTVLFDDLRPLFDQIPPKESRRQAAFIIRKMNLKPGQRFLDCPCGIGRISIPLARKGIKVTGVDLTESYLDELHKKAARSKLPINCIISDMRRISFDRQFHGAANLWTSFGYFPKEADNLRVLKKAYQALKPGGRFVLHVINRDWIIANFEESDWMQAGNVRILQQRSFDFATSRSTGTWIFLKEDGESQYDVSIRMYSFHELIPMFTKAGFVDIEGFGSPDEESITHRSRMMWIFGTRPRT